MTDTTHRAIVATWIQRAPQEPVALVRAFEATFAALWQRTRLTLGDVTLNAILVELVTNAEFATFSVQDTGCGIAVTDLPHVFEPHWQAKTTAHQGRGRGLAIAKGIIEGHGGALSVASQVGRGTTFSFTLPLAGGPVERTSGLIASYSDLATGLQEPRVLVIDDEVNALGAR